MINSISSFKKINLSSLRVLQTLMCLFEQDLTMHELIQKMDTLGLGKFNNFVLSKYINTCKSCGIDIQKIRNKYSIMNFPIGMKFSAEEGEILYEIKQFSESLKIDKTEKIITNFLSKLHLPLFKTNNGLLSSKNYRIIRLFEQACSKKCDIRIIYKDNSFFDCSPTDIKVRDNKVVFHITNKKESKEIDIDDIVDIKNLDIQNENNSQIVTVLYELRGQLAKRYQLRENEQIIQIKKNGNIVIANKYEDKNELLHRLLRYDSLCKILRPLNYVEDMKKIIQNSLKNYEN